MKCRCGGSTHVIRVDAPPRVPDGNVARVRVCGKCKQRFRTVECRASEADFVEAFKFITTKKRAIA